MSWSTQFGDPIILPDGRELLTFRDAAEYITKLPKAEHDAEEWQIAVKHLILAAENGGGWLMLAPMAVSQALNRNVERVFNPDRKKTNWGKRKLKRDT